MSSYMVVFFVLSTFIVLFGIILIRVDLYKIKQALGLIKAENKDNMKDVYCLNDNKHYFFMAITNLKALECMLYALNLSRKDPDAVIKTSERCYWFDHNGKTYSILKEHY